MKKLPSAAEALDAVQVDDDGAALAVRIQALFSLRSLLPHGVVLAGIQTRPAVKKSSVNGSMLNAISPTLSLRSDRFCRPPSGLRPRSRLRADRARVSYRGSRGSVAGRMTYESTDRLAGTVRAVQACATCLS